MSFYSRSFYWFSLTYWIATLRYWSSFSLFWMRSCISNVMSFSRFLSICSSYFSRCLSISFRYLNSSTIVRFSSRSWAYFLRSRSFSSFSALIFSILSSLSASIFFSCHSRSYWRLLITSSWPKLDDRTPLTEFDCLLRPRSVFRCPRPSAALNSFCLAYSLASLYLMIRSFLSSTSFKYCLWASKCALTPISSAVGTARLIAVMNATVSLLPTLVLTLRKS